MSGKFELKKSANGQFYFNLKSSNGQIVLASEMYKAKASALNGMKSICNNCKDDSRFVRKKSTNGKPFFVLRAKNHQVIGKSQMYNSGKAMENGIASVKKNAGKAKLVDLTEK
ncbi:MAG: YegP family protein [Gammaproteobacteria bacterium]|nr:YegP family protein [Gammaproteobacteria bacterium]NNC97766.1 YegP family protein [Gammaproteobacteria bacterium]NNM13925.1 YegP family protein [Gammaproteobacteria bacterium]